MKRLVVLAGLLAGFLFVPVANATCFFNCTYTKTKYPIVLVHGLFGFSQIGGAVDYFYQVPAALQNQGATVFTPAVSPVDSNEVRGEQLLAAVQNILAVTGAQKVNLIGHSQGSPTARYVAAVIPANVASVTSIAGVNKGAPLADVILDVNQYTPVLGSAVNDIVNSVGTLIGVASGQPFPPNAIAAMQSLSTAGSLAFDQKYPRGVPATNCGEGAYSAAVAGGTQYYYSWTGNAPTMTNLFDILDPLLVLAESAFLIAPDQNDTLVGVCSSKFGKVLRTDYPWNHLDEVNQVTGLIGLGAPDPVQVIVTHANRLKNQGL